LCAVSIYGITFQSQWPIPGALSSHGEPPRVKLFERSASFFAQVAREAGLAQSPVDWFFHARLQDGSDYLRWSGLFEFVVSPDGRDIAGRPLTDVPRESFQTYLLGQVLSYALLKLGLEPLHATVVVVDGWSAGLLGTSGYGKSSLAAAFLQAGHRLLTDDLLLIKDGPRGPCAFPGLPRIKLFPEVAQAFLGSVSGLPMNPDATKLVIPLEPDRVEQIARPMGAIYVLCPPAVQSESRNIRICDMHPSDAVLKLIGGTFNKTISDPDRLARQFRQAARVAIGVPVKSLCYPRELSELPRVVEAIRSDLRRKACGFPTAS
jgi:hypothetical protein